MAKLLYGAPVAAALDEKTAAIVNELAQRGVTPTLAILRVGERKNDISYERGAVKRCAGLGIAVRSVTLPENVESDVFFDNLDGLCRDAGVHGMLMFRPLPAQLDEERARRMLPPEKDVDGCTDGSLAGVFTGTRLGFAPCTARAAVELLGHYGIDCAGRRVVVVGRSLVVGRPAAMLLLGKNATVTICHSKTADIAGVIRSADIVIACSGQTESIGAAQLSRGQTVIDVGIEWNEKRQKLCGDVNFEQAEPLVSALTPVPGGVGAVTTSVLAMHTAEAARRAATR